MWNEIIITVNPVICQQVCDLFADANFDGMYIEDYSDMLDNELVRRTNLVEKDLLDKIGQDSIIHCYLGPDKNFAEISESTKNILLENKIDCKICVEPVIEKNWAEEWKKYFKPVPVGKNLVVVPSWENYQPASNEIIIKIDPGAAFGTGTHETTRLCLEALEEQICGDEKLLDIGTGSGILAIASLLLGVSAAVGIDIDPLSISAANRNAELNGFTGKIHVIEGNLADKITDKFDIITANIVSDTIIGLLNTIRNNLDDNGKIILSGIIDSRENDVLATVKENNFTVFKRKSMGEWVCLIIG